MDIDTCIARLLERGYDVEETTPSNGQREWLVFNPNSPLFYENGGSPSTHDDQELMFWVQHVMSCAWAEEDKEAKNGASG